MPASRFRTILRHRWMRAPAALCLAAALVSCQAGDEPLTGPPDRIVLIVVDTLRRDHVSAYGGSVETPHMDRLAARGQRFDRALSSFHQTTMSMASLFTGRTPSLEWRGRREAMPFNGRSWCGMMRFEGGADDAQCLPGSLRTLAEALGETGYWTAGVVTNLLLHRPGGYEQGFDRWEEIVQMPPTAVAANRAVERVLDERPGDHFFLYVHYMDVHDFGRRGQSYATGPPLVDAAVGELMTMLETRGLSDGTLVVLTSDHGERLAEQHFVGGLGGHNGNPSFDPLVRVPLIVAPPAFPEPDAPIRSDDLHRMLLEVAGATPGAPPDLEPGELYLSEIHYQTYRRGRWKLFRDRLAGTVHLVDLEADPGERIDVAGRHPETVRELTTRMDELARTLEADADASAMDLNPRDRERLQALGYLRYVEVPGP